MKQRYLCKVQELTADSVPIFESDSTLSVVVSEAPVVSLFENHHLPNQHDLEFIPKTGSGNSFVFITLFLCAATILYLQRSSDNIFGAIFKAGFDQNQAQQDARVENSQRARNMFVLQVLGAVSISLFVAASAINTLALNRIHQVFFATLGCLIGYVFIKRLILWLLAQVFELQPELKVHRFNLSIFLSLAGLFLIPFSLIMMFSPVIPSLFVLYIGLGILVFFYLKTLQRGVVISLRSTSISSLYLFYYLCALEILPVFVLIRLVLDMQ